MWVQRTLSAYRRTAVAEAADRPVATWCHSGQLVERRLAEFRQRRTPLDSRSRAA